MYVGFDFFFFFFPVGRDLLFEVLLIWVKKIYYLSQQAFSKQNAMNIHPWENNIDLP
jgi:hypothetical protein